MGLQIQIQPILIKNQYSTASIYINQINRNFYLAHMNLSIPYYDSSGIKIDRLKQQMDRRLQKIRRMVNQGFKKHKKKRRSRDFNDFPGRQEAVQTDCQIQQLVTPKNWIGIQLGKQISSVQSQKSQQLTGANSYRQRNKKLTISSLGTQINIQRCSERLKSPTHSFELQRKGRSFNIRHKTTEANNQQSQQQYEIPIEENLEFQDSLDQQKYVQQCHQSLRNNQKQSPFRERIAKIAQLSIAMSPRLKIEQATFKQRIQKENDSSKQAISPISKHSPTSRNSPISKQGLPKNLVNIKTSHQKSGKKLKRVQEKQYERAFKTEMQQENSKLSLENDCQEGYSNNSFMKQLIQQDFRATVNVAQSNQTISKAQASTQRRRIVKDVVKRLSPQKGEQKQKKTKKQLPCQQKVIVSLKTKQKMQNLVKVISQKPKREANDCTVRSNLLKRIEDKNKKR